MFLRQENILIIDAFEKLDRYLGFNSLNKNLVDHPVVEFRKLFRDA